MEKLCHYCNLALTDKDQSQYHLDCRIEYLERSFEKMKTQIDNLDDTKLKELPPPVFNTVKEAWRLLIRGMREALYIKNEQSREEIDKTLVARFKFLRERKIL